MNKELIYSLANSFNLDGDIIDIRPFGEGLINTTFLIETSKNKYILQKINNQVFKDADALMNNIALVSDFLRAKGQESLVIVPTKENKLYQCFEGGYYRVYVFVKDTVCYQKVDNLDLVRSAGASFGELHYLLSDFPVEKIVEVIPDFHNTEKRFLDFKDAYSKADKSVIESAKKEIEYIFAHENTYDIVNKYLSSGEAKIRVTHNDTKINNILFDKNTGKCRCVIDLDTVMPGSVLYDIGDAFRGMFTGDNEDNRNSSLLKVDFDIYREYTKTYLGKMKNSLTKKEIELIPFSIYLLSVELGIRFLEDYLRGNIYFSSSHEQQNLIRSRNQLALAEDVLKNIDKLNKITKNILLI